MSTVLVPGGAGYIGSHSVKALAAAGYDVVVYDNLLAGHRESVERVASRYPDRSVTLVEGDILDGARLRETLERTRATAVMHFAALLSVAVSTREPSAYYRTNVTGTLTVLDAMIQAGVKQFIFSSTAATFGEPERTPIDEQHPQRPINAYGETKLAVERALPHLERAHGLRWVVLRYFNAAGADPEGLIGEDHEPEEHLIPNALKAALGGPAMTVFGDDYPTPDGTCVRDYVHVTDLADAHLRALRRLEQGEPSGAFNLGTGQGMTVRQVLDAAGRAAGRPVPHVIGPRRAGDPVRLVASNEAARRELGWQPSHSDVQSIVDTAWRWHRTHPKGYSSAE